jgi:hypothetical protein
VEPVPGRSSIYRCLVRHGLITPEARKRKRSDCKRWERSRAMELWQMDIVGGVNENAGFSWPLLRGFAPLMPSWGCSNVLPSPGAGVFQAASETASARAASGRASSRSRKTFLAT